MWLSNHIYNHCLEKSLDWHQPIQMIGHDLMYAQEHFGKLARMHVLIWRFFTPMFPATAPEVCLSCTRSMKMKIKRTYGCVLKVKHGIFPPLILSTSGGMGREAQTFYKCLADLLSLKRWISPRTLNKSIISKTVHTAEKLLYSTKFSRDSLGSEIRAVDT